MQLNINLLPSINGPRSRAFFDSLYTSHASKPSMSGVGMAT
jgi:hypothetical protein